MPCKIPRKAKVATVNSPDKSGDGAAKVLDLVGKAESLSGLPYLSVAAGLALRLVRMAPDIKENQEGFLKLTNDSTQLVAVFYCSYQGAQNQEDWLNSDGIRTSAKVLERCLDDILRFGTKMIERNRFLRVLYHLADANTIKKYRQELASATVQFQIAAQIDARETLAQIFRGQDELRDEASHLVTSSCQEATSTTSVGTAIQNENRARRRIEIGNLTAPGVTFSDVSAVIENRATQPGSINADSNRPGIRLLGVSNSAISLGRANVTVRNG